MINTFFSFKNLYNDTFQGTPPQAKFTFCAENHLSTFKSSVTEPAPH